MRFLLAIFLNVLFFCPVSAQIYIGQSDIPYTLSGVGDTVYVTENLDGTGIPYAINITASNVVINGQGHSIPIWPGGKAITSEGGVSNIEIKNVISNSGSSYGHSLHLSGITDPNIHDNELTSAVFMNLTGGSVYNNKLCDINSSGNYALDFSATHGTTIKGNKSVVKTWIQIFSSKNISFEDNHTNLWVEDSDSVCGFGNKIDELVQKNCTNINVGTLLGTKEQKKEDEDKGFYLSQNYPNPFNSTTEINFFLPNACEVNLVVFNALGRKIITLASGRFSFGQHSVQWMAQNMTSGIYVYKLVAGNFTATKKIFFLK